MKLNDAYFDSEVSRLKSSAFLKDRMPLATAYKLHLHDKAELIAAARECALHDLEKFIKPDRSALGKWLDGEGYAVYGTFAEFTRLRIAHTTFYSVVKVLASMESRKEIQDFLSGLLGSPHLNSASLAVGVAAHQLQSVAEKPPV